MFYYYFVYLILHLQTDVFLCLIAFSWTKASLYIKPFSFDDSFLLSLSLSLSLALSLSLSLSPSFSLCLSLSLFSLPPSLSLSLSLSPYLTLSLSLSLSLSLFQYLLTMIKKNIIYCYLFSFSGLYIGFVHPSPPYILSLTLSTITFHFLSLYLLTMITTSFIVIFFPSPICVPVSFSVCEEP